MFTIISILILLSVINLQDFVARLLHADLRFILLGAGLVVIHPFLRAMRWETILRTETPFWAIFHAENIGYLVNNMLPLRAGEPARAVMLSRSTKIPAVELLSTVVIARTSDMIAVLALLGLVIPALDVSDSVRLAGYGTLLLALALVICIVIGIFAKRQLIGLLTAFCNRFIPNVLAIRLLSWATDFLNGLQMLREGRRLMALTLTTAVLWLAYLLYSQFILLAFVPSTPLAWATLATCTASLSTVIPSSPAYVGVYHAVVAFTLTPFIGQDAALGYAIALHAIEFIAVLLFGLLSLAVSGTSLGKVTSRAVALSESAPS